ncbi:hypothetical protein, unlikely [Trypanosoma brucei gambiense DAL972]|uniref:Uncharacterized protein n=1 Tax=Trypanosoma brucei gambiense (strain MHOM/CI/86/DAL972) TaxID=679716 RepID=C9ZJE0_TRYB9|nr:hypothetical protein, unlikely [Trypanosoma brucei gambiense DAL972]CBH09499.1 hypothetical protein, unlikely [Trypanosoma brucei gambiense DAL972]|eukprot:XP_011771804.1 hypothetical protein, unlikely [Trypanosoma brucei gambiense DAL972]
MFASGRAFSLLSLFPLLFFVLVLITYTSIVPPLFTLSFSSCSSFTFVLCNCLLSFYRMIVVVMCSTFFSFFFQNWYCMTPSSFCCCCCSFFFLFFRRNTCCVGHSTEEIQGKGTKT